MPRKEPAKTITQNEYPALREFFRGYLHEDLQDEYGSPQNAAKQFMQDADQNQRATVAEEWSALLQRTRNFTLGQMNQGLQQLGSAWTFESLAEIQGVADVFRKNPSGRKA
jgi:hypothetical protein